MTLREEKVQEMFLAEDSFRLITASFVTEMM
jgi:hypothetical protein